MLWAYFYLGRTVSEGEVLPQFQVGGPGLNQVTGPGKLFGGIIGCLPPPWWGDLLPVARPHLFTPQPPWGTHPLVILLQCRR